MFKLLCYFLKMKENSLFKKMFVTGIAFVLYGAAMILMLGFHYFFNYFYLVWGIVLMFTAYYHETIYEKLGKKMYGILRIITYICLSIFLIVEGIILVCSFSKPDKNASIIIVLGSGVNRDKSLSRDFKARLDSCLEYYEENGGTIILTGKKGRDEPVAEAIAGKQYLLKKGVSENAIRVDDKSSNTYENIRNAYELSRDIKDRKTVIVSSCFHLFRANFIAHKVGFRNVSLKGSIGGYGTLLHSYTREFFAFVKDFLVLKKSFKIIE